MVRNLVTLNLGPAKDSASRFMMQGVGIAISRLAMPKEEGKCGSFAKRFLVATKCLVPCRFLRKLMDPQKTNLLEDLVTVPCHFSSLQCTHIAVARENVSFRCFMTPPVASTKMLRILTFEWN